MQNKDKIYSDKDAMRKLVSEAIENHKIGFLVELLCKLQDDYIDLARLSTDDNYQSNWTHKQVLDYITYEL